jgi:3-hydroxyisobutyrate dehydrogenase-like beta-hydroxyacid dehydrogenase
MKIGIIGYGEIGRAIEALYHKNNIEPKVLDWERDDGLEGTDYLHICFPYGPRFVHWVRSYINHYNPKATIIHSTVAPGTTDELSEYAIVHSPVRGVHPNLLEGLLTFEKVVAGNASTEVAEHLNSLGLKVKIYKDAITSEVAKLLSTTYYGVCIAFHDYANKVCKDTGANFFEAMTEWNNDYNEGYRELDMPHVVRPVLYPPEGSIGGHCVIPNAEIIKEIVHSSLIQAVLNLK